MIAGRSISGGRHLGHDGAELVDRSGRVVAVDDGVGATQHAEQRPSPAAVLGAPAISPGISTSWTSTPPIRVSAGTGRGVVNG